MRTESVEFGGGSKPREAESVSRELGAGPWIQGTV